MTATTKTLPKIRQLPPNLINQNAAGEVIERPASVVKELLENSIDAGATRIEVTIAGGGSELIRISDNGCGMSAEQLPLAVASHATSKLPDEEALFHVSTLGFRGEALASIGSVSQLTIRSRTADDDCGAEIQVRGGVVEPAEPCGCPVGTVMEVRNLFFNTPVRHRFLKTAQTEKGHIVEAFTRLALANPSVHFVLSHNDKVLHDLPATNRWAQRIHEFFGAEISEALIPISSDDGQIRIIGHVCDPSVSRGNNRMQYLFLNGRHIRDRALQHALTEAYRGLLMVGRHPVCFLRMEMPADLIDVNVHPTKLEVRFTDSGRVYSRLLQSLRHQFLTTNLTQRVGPPVATDPQADPQRMTDPELGLPEAIQREQRQSVIDWARTGQSGSSSESNSAESNSARRELPGAIAPFQPFPDRNLHPTDPASTRSSAYADVSGGHHNRNDEVGSRADVAPWEVDSDSVDSESTRGDGPSVSYLGFQVHNRYLVTQDEAGMVVIDQHALHERVLYERVSAKVLGEGSSLESQRLLVPEPVSLTPSERTAALDAKETLSRIGIEIEDFGGETILVQSYPAILGRTSPGEMLRILLESLMGFGKTPDPKDLLNHLLSTIACTAAVKAGDRLTAEEITS